jgi:hypothetical protein
MSDHDTDIVAWAEEQAQVLRAWRPRVEVTSGSNVIDWQNIIMEIEELARSHRRELASRISNILVQFLKLSASPATDPHPGWRTTIRTERAEIERLLADAPSLRPIVPDVIDLELRPARMLAEGALADYGEEPTVDIGTLIYTPDQVL